MVSSFCKVVRLCGRVEEIGNPLSVAAARCQPLAQCAELLRQRLQLGQRALRALQHAGGNLFSRIAQCPADRKSTRLNSSHTVISYAVFCFKKKKYLIPDPNDDFPCFMASRGFSS